MRKKNNKAFTMVELLAAITILGLLMSVAIIGVTRVMEKAKREYYKNQNDNVVLATQSYAQNNTGKLPKNIGQKVKVKLSELVNDKYLKEKVKDYGKNNCNMDESYVEIVKISKQDYAYNVVLKCPAYNSLKDPNIDKSTPDINIIFSKEPESIATINIVGNDRIISYNYIVYFKKNASDNYREVKNSGSVAVSSKESLKLTIKLNEYVPGQIKIQASATNSYGKTKNANSSKSYMDSNPPKCVYGKYKYTKGSKDHLAWTNSSRKVTIGCADTESGCEQDVYTKTFSSDAESAIITIKDKSGNTTDCKVQVYVDKTPPTCTSSGGSSKWVKNLTLVGKCKDNLSGCVNKSAKDRTYSSGNVNWAIKTNMKQDNVSPGTVYDAANNSVTCPANQKVMVDSVKPTISVSNPSKGWTNKDIVLTLNSKDDFSGIAYHQYRYKDRDNISWTTYSDSAKNVFVTTPFSKERNENAYLRVCDNAGNCAETSTMIKIDKTKPTCGTISGASTSWGRGTRKISLTCNDKAGSSIATASGCVENPYNRSYSGSQQTEKIVIADKAGNSNSCPVNVYLDNTPPACPTITSATAANTWQKNDVSFKFTFASDVTKYKWYTRTGSDSWVDWGENKPSVTSKTITGDGNRSVAVEVYDAVGNKSFCEAPAHYYIDKTAPVCGSNNGTTSWAKGNRVVSVNCSDAGSGCTQSSYSRTFSGSIVTSDSITIADNLGNTRNCPVNVYLDNVAPTCGAVTGASTVWKSGTRTISVGCSDANSGCTQGTFSQTFSGTKQTDSVTISDKVGNTKSCPVNVYIDNTLPGCPTFVAKKASGTVISNDRGNNDDIYYYLSFPSDVVKFEWLTRNGKGAAFNSFGIKPSSTTVIPIYSTGYRQVAVRVYDAVNNSSYCEDPNHYYIDKTAPNAPVVTFTKKTNRKATATVKCSDVKDSKDFKSGVVKCGIKGSEADGNKTEVVVTKGTEYTFRAIDRAGNKKAKKYTWTG